jgi:preprotein translocase subunit SecD
MSGERMIANLPTQRAPVSRLPHFLAGAAAAAVCFIALLVFWPDAEPPAPPPLPTGPLLFFEVPTEAKAVAEVMESRIEGAKAVADEAGQRLVVVLPKNADPAAARALLLRPGHLTFRLVVDHSPGEEPPPNTEWLHDAGTGEPILVEIPQADTEDFGAPDLDPGEIHAQPDPHGRWVVQFALREDRRDDFADFTRRSLKRMLAIVVDGKVLSAPVIQDALPGRAIISGGGTEGFSRAEAEELATILRSGPLPTDVTPYEPK